MTINNNSAADVAIFYNTKDVYLKRNCYVYNNLSVLGSCTFANIINL